MLADTKFEFGVDEHGKLHLIDEILTVGDEQFQRRCVEKFDDFKDAGKDMEYTLFVPSGYDKARKSPLVIALHGLGGNPQQFMRTRGLTEQAEKRGYIVIAPAAPSTGLFFEGGARIIPEFLKMILAEYKIQDGKFHIAGPSNGGIAAMHVAAANPQYFASVTAFPGYMWEPSTAKLAAISKMCVFLYVGEDDEYMWHGEMRKEAQFLRGLGTIASYTVEKGQPHRMETLAGTHASRLFDGFEQTKQGCVR